MKLHDKNQSLVSLENVACVERSVESFENHPWRNDGEKDILLTIHWCAMDCCRHFEYSNEEECKLDYNTIDMFLCRRENG